MAKTDQFLHSLIPDTGLWAWYPLNTATAIDTPGIEDVSGNDRHLLSLGTTHAVYEEDALNDRRAVVHDGSAKPVGVSATVSLQHIFICAKSTENPFTAFRGLITDTATQRMLRSENSGTNFTDLSFGGDFSYRKSQFSYAEASQAAPVSEYELIEISLTSGGGFNFTGSVQIGRDLTDVARNWAGKWTDAVMFTSVLSAAELARIRLYFDLKFGLWSLNSTTLVFPSADIVPVHGANYYSRYYKHPPDKGAVMRSHEYDDGGEDRIETNTTAPQRWDLEMNGISALEADVYSEFYSAAGEANSFTFTEKDGTTQTGVYIDRFARRHNANKSWLVDCSFTLVKYPV